MGRPRTFNAEVETAISDWIAFRQDIRKTPYHTTSCKHMSMLTCVNATGDSLPLFVIAAGSALNSSELDELIEIPSIHSGNSKSGYINEDLYTQWFKTVFLKEIERQRTARGAPDDEPHVLFFDGLKSHGLLDIRKADDVIFHILKGNVRKLFSDLKFNFPNRGVLIKLIVEAWDMIPKSKFKAAFRCTGIWPFPKLATSPLPNQILKRLIKTRDVQCLSTPLVVDDDMGEAVSSSVSGPSSSSSSSTTQPTHSQIASDDADDALKQALTTLFHSHCKGKRGETLFQSGLQHLKNLGKGCNFTQFQRSSMHHGRVVNNQQAIAELEQEVQKKKEAKLVKQVAKEERDAAREAKKAKTKDKQQKGGKSSSTSQVKSTPVAPHPKKQTKTPTPPSTTKLGGRGGVKARMDHNNSKRKFQPTHPPVGEPATKRVKPSPPPPPSLPYPLFALL
eukprot:TRINITY_DN66779_c0_g1_i4.p1 TRINITY_DN66779_c0_g1~~TRINITY_DN66779_c0_g1_i4.p1  ORF type:complete len:449 (-),score=54.22 TRINITY_DN66779_c0_g1_i4:372-1718(-)